MLLFNKSRDRHLRVINIDGQEQEVGPGDKVEVTKLEGENLIHNYSDVFKEVETTENIFDLKAKVTRLEGENLAKDNLIDELNKENADLRSKLGMEARKVAETSSDDEENEDEDESNDPYAGMSDEEKAAYDEKLEAIHKEYKEATGKDVAENKFHDIAYLEKAIETAKQKAEEKAAKEKEKADAKAAKEAEKAKKKNK